MLDIALDFEQFNWICNIDKDEGDKLSGLLGTGKWVLDWRGEEHGFVLKRTAPIIDLQYDRDDNLNTEEL